MKFLNILRHIGIVTAGVILIIGVPLWCSGSIHSLFSGNIDTISGASVILDAPSGEYVVMINRKLHLNSENLDKWIRFFSDDTEEDEVIIIFEDVSCSVSKYDLTGREMAESYRSRLPENQMKVIPEDGTLIVSRADNGLFDMIIMSKEYAEIVKAETAYTDNVCVINVTGGPRS